MLHKTCVNVFKSKSSQYGLIETEEQLWRLDWKMGNSGGETHILGKQQALVGVFRPGGESADWWGQWAGPAERGIRGGHR